jgi:signal transduction histidine kinase
MRASHKSLGGAAAVQPDKRMGNREAKQMRKEEIAILLLEDNRKDIELIRHALQAGGVAFRLDCVDTRADFVERLARSPPTLILSDFTLPEFDGYAALEITARECPDVPFIFVTGTMGEEVAIEAVKKGATDYVLKHRLGRLVPSVNRALREARERAERRRAQQQLHDSREQLHALTVYLQYVREEERIRIAREVHDELGQALTALKLQLTWLSRHLPVELKSLHDRAMAMSGQIDETVQAVRRIATELRPAVLDNAGLQAAIEWQAAQFEKQTRIQCRVKSRVQQPVWDQDLNTAFFRIFQEALTNVVRHAEATRVDVNLMEVSGWLVLQIKDNGRGISETEETNMRSIGLLGMRERAGMLGGEVRVRGSPGGGTTVSVRIPWRPPAQTQTA